MARGSEYDAAPTGRAASQTFSPSIAGLLLNSNVEREPNHSYAAQDYFADDTDYDEEAADRAELARRLGVEDAPSAQEQHGRAGTTRASSFSHLLAPESSRAGNTHQDNDQNSSRTTKRPRLAFETDMDMLPPANRHSHAFSETAAVSDVDRPANSRTTSNNSNDQRSSVAAQTTIGAVVAATTTKKTGLPPPRFTPTAGTTLAREVGEAVLPPLPVPAPKVKTKRAVAPPPAPAPSPPPRPPSPQLSVSPVVPPPNRSPSPIPIPVAPPRPPPAAPITRERSQPPAQLYAPSIFAIEPIDEFTREVADWLWAFCQHLDVNVVEIEAKIGVLLDTNTKLRYGLPVPIETILMDDSGLRFQSNMSLNQHKHFNGLLNQRVEASDPTESRTRIRYAHTREVDTFHSLGENRKARVTRDQANGQVQRIVEKTRVADMNITSPKRLFDWRISVSLENQVAPPTNHSDHTRYKDRISYTHQLFQIDLTQVSSTGPGSGPFTHELEIEFRDARVLLQEAAREARGEPNQYLEMVQIFLNNIRMLIRNASNP